MMNKFIAGALILSLSLPAMGHEKQIREILDLQLHATVHEPYGFFGKGLTWLPENKKQAGRIEQKLSHKHTFKNIMYADFYKQNSGSRIIINGTLAAEVAFNKRQATKLTLKQIDYLDNVAKENPEVFAVARTPQEVRNAIHNSDKTVIIHSIEGARKLIRSAEDARFWASKGVSYITLIHLLDDEYGYSAISEDGVTPIINFRGWFHRLFKPEKRRGLTELGKNAVRWIVEAGMMVDLTHMHPDSKDDTLDILEELGSPPLVTHGHFQPYQGHARGLTKEQITRIYRLGGLFATPNSGERLKLVKTDESVIKMLDEDENFCEGSLDNFLYTWNAVNAHVKEQSKEIMGSNFEELSENEKVQMSVGFSTDFNGWVNHGHPRYGKKGCFEIKKDMKLDSVDLRGLAHPGLLETYWANLENRGMDLDSLKRSSEKFLQMWEKARRIGGFPDPRSSEGYFLDL